MVIAAVMWFSSPQTILHIKIASVLQGKVTNAHALGHVIYTHYMLIFQAAGLILLVAMIGAIVLTLRQRAGVRRQNISQQVNRAVADTLEIKKVSFRQGVR
jgi:NADH-quinone oxidoreductase subunit J